MFGRKKLKNEIKKLESMLNSTIDKSSIISYSNVDTSRFKTKKYVNKFEDYETLPDEVYLNKFNELLNEEKKYVDAIYDVLQFIIYRPNKKTSIEKQIRSNILTANGNIAFDDFIFNESHLI